NLRTFLGTFSQHALVYPTTPHALDFHPRPPTIDKRLIQVFLALSYLFQSFLFPTTISPNTTVYFYHFLTFPKIFGSILQKLPPEGCANVQTIDPKAGVFDDLSIS